MSHVLKPYHQTLDSMSPQVLTQAQIAKIDKRHKEVMWWAKECLAPADCARFRIAVRDGHFIAAHDILVNHGGWIWQRIRWSRWLADHS